MKENRVLTIDNLTTTFESHKQKIQAVRGVSLHVDEGDILAIVGESGSGKSVTMKSVMGLLGENADVQADHLELLQKDLLSMSEKEKRKMIDAYVTKVNERWILYAESLYQAGMQKILELLNL